MYKGVVFDLDGTLVDSRLCFKTIRRQLGIPEGEWILEYLETLPPTEKSLKLTKLEQIELDAAKTAVPFAGVLNLIEELRLKDIKLGIFTRNCSAVVHHIVEAFGMTFDLVVTRDDAPPKPDPTGIKKILAQWNIENHELLFVGDARSDIECGKNAGVRTALFTNGIENDGAWGPDHIFSDYSMFLKHESMNA